MDKIKRQNRLMIMGAMILLGALVIWSIGFEIYARNTEKSEIFKDRISRLTLNLDNTQLNIEKGDVEYPGYSFTRSASIEWKMYGEELRLQARGGILDLTIPESSDIESIHIRNSKEEIYLSSLKLGELKVESDGKLTVQGLDSRRAKLDVLSADISSSEFDTLFITTTDRLDITETDIEALSALFGPAGCSILGGDIEKVAATSGEGVMEIEPDNGIFSITVTGGASTIFIDNEDTSSQSYQDKDNPEGALIEFTSPKGSVKIC